MFLQACVCPRGRVPDQVRPLPAPGTPPGTRYTPRTRYTPWDQVHPPGPGTSPRLGAPPRTRYTPPDQVHTPLGPGTPPRTRYTPSPGPGTPNPPRPGTPPSDQAPPRTWYTPLRYGHCCGWYASYWNAFLFKDQNTSN